MPNYLPIKEKQRTGSTQTIACSQAKNAITYLPKERDTNLGLEDKKGERRGMNKKKNPPKA